MDIKEFIQVKDQNFKRHPWELARLRMLRYFIGQCKENKTIIDIGSGDAFLSSEIAKKYPESSVTAIDINYTSELVKELTIDKPKNLYLLADVNSIDSICHIDVVVLMDVLEHVKNPALLLKKIIDLPSISPKTVFIITVPAYQELFSQHDRNLGHHMRYNLYSLNKLLQPFSFKINKNGYCFNSLILVRLLQLFKEKKGRKKYTDDSIHNWKGNAWLTSFITNLFWIEFKISWYLARIGIKMPGLTCYSICQPSPS